MDSTESLDRYELDRYDRQIMILGQDGQVRLKELSILVAGLGGLGSVVSLYLAAAGIGRIKLTDNDKVELSNLNRQIIHWDRDIGRSKADSAHEKLSELNPRIQLEHTSRTIDEDSVSTLLNGVDGVVDAMDNFPTRYVLNRACLKKKIPFFHGAIHGLIGQVTTIVPNKTSCLRCIFPVAPPKEKFPVLGATAALIGSIQVMEVVKYFTGKGELLKNKLLIFDGEEVQWFEVELKRNPKCPDCG